MINLNYTKEQIEQTPIKDKLAHDWLTLYDELTRLNKALQGAMEEMTNKEQQEYSDARTSDDPNLQSHHRGYGNITGDCLDILRRHLGKE